MKRNESRKRTLPIIHLFYMLFLAVLACSGVGHAGDLEFHTNPERGLAPRCTYNTAIDDLQYGFIPDLPNKNDCCQTHGASLSELGRLMWPCLCKDEYDSTYPTCQNRQPYRVISLSSTLSGFMDADDPLGEAAYVSKYPGADDLQGACLMEENQMGYNPIGIPMQNSDGSLTDNGLIYLYGMQKTFKQALDNGIKLQLFFNYNPGDIPRDFVLGCDSADPARPCSPATHEFFSEVFPKDYVKVVGHMETIREFLFNPDCPLDEAAALKDSNCLVQYTKADGTQYSLAKTNLASLVHSFGNSFVGAAGAEWHSSCWPDDWETGENADLNRKAVLDAIMEMVPGRKVLLRRPLIKNDYFDGIDDNGHDYTYFGVHGPPEATPTNDCDWYEDLEPVSQADLTDWTPLPEGGTLTIDWDYARNHLGYFNAAFMANGNERNTIPGPPYATNPNIACIDNASAQINTTDRQAESKYSDYHLYYNADAPGPVRMQKSASLSHTIWVLTVLRRPILLLKKMLMPGKQQCGISAMKMGRHRPNRKMSTAPKTSIMVTLTNTVRR